MVTRAPDGRALLGRFVRLDPTVPGDAAALFRALDDERIYAVGFGGGVAARPADAGEMAPTVRAAIADPDRTMYTARARAGGLQAPGEAVIGTTSLGEISLIDERVQLGWTAYHPAVWGTAVNPECKLLLLEHAFDHCGFGRVKIQTDGVNLRSQAAIERLGAKREGVLRRHRRRADGTFRDTVVFSILAGEWPGVRQRLLERLAAFGTAAPPGANR